MNQVGLAGIMAMMAAVIGSAQAAMLLSPVKNADFELRNGKVPKDWNVGSENYSAAFGAGMNGGGGLMFSAAEGTSAGEPVWQEIRLTPGIPYKLRAWIKTENLKSESRAAGVAIEWWTDKDFYRDFRTAYVSGTSPWKRVELELPRIPEGINIVKCRLSVYAGFGKVSGKAWFDGVSVDPIIKPAVSGLYCNAYRGKVVGGPVTVCASLDIPEDLCKSGRCRAILRWKDESGKICEKSTKSVSPDSARFELAADELPMGKTLLGCGVYTNGCIAGKASCAVERVAKRPDWRVWFDRYGRCFVDGKPFFPLGVYDNTPSVENMKTLRQHGFNTVLDYAQATQEKMDEYAANGLMVVYGLKNCYYGYEWCPKEITSEAEEEPFILRHIERFRNHPALLAWYLNDESPLAMAPRLAKRRAFFEKNDPDHPTYNLGWEIEYFRDFMDSIDIVGSDPYPVNRRSIALAGDWTIATRKNTLGVRPIWQTPQAFSWKWFHKEDVTDRMPTTSELRFMCWQMVACGSNGFLFYAFHQMRGKSSEFEKDFATLTDVNEELAKFTDIFTAEPARLSYKTGIGEDLLSVRFWEKNGEVYVLLANSQTKEYKAEIELDRRFETVETLFGSAQAKMSGNKLTVALGAFDQVLLRLK